MFNEGYAAIEGEALIRRELSAEAIRLGRLLAELMPDESDVMALLALMLLHDSRRNTRVSADGDLVLLEAQDRSLWDRNEIDEGLQLVDRSLRVGRVGPYGIQAAIAAIHAQASPPDGTDWPQIAALYSTLEHMQPSPVVALNRAVAVAMADGPERGLELMTPLAERLDAYHWFHAAHADLLRRLDRFAEAAIAYERALMRATNEVERRFIERRLEEMRT
jgi:RNA polymerase sigma-70 factor (ECF subfamily)